MDVGWTGIGLDVDVGHPGRDHGGPVAPRAGISALVEQLQSGGGADPLVVSVALSTIYLDADPDARCACGLPCLWHQPAARAGRGALACFPSCVDY